MMRIVCPTCGEEPVKGQRHVCQATPSSAVLALEGPGIGQGGIRRRNPASVASAGAVCSSVASLVSKQPGLWRSSKALARASSDDFVAASLQWHQPLLYKDPKKSVLQVFLKQVQHEAAKSVQEMWRRWRQGKKPRQKQYADGYLQLELTLPVARNRQEANAAVQNANGMGTNNVSSGPRQPDQAKRGGAVPMNPIQALKQRRQQKERTAEEEEEAQLKQAMEVAASMMLAERQHSSTPSAPSTPRRAPQALPPVPTAISPRHAAPDSHRAFPPAEIQKEPSNFSQGTVSPASTSLPSPSDQAALPPSMPAPAAHRRGRDDQDSAKPKAELALQNEVSSAPPTISGWRPPSPTTRNDDVIRPSSQQDQSATERLRERMRQRESGTSMPKGSRTSAPNSSSGQQAPSSSGSGSGNGAAADWKLRIEARRREAEEQQQQEQQHKHTIQERAGRRNEAMSRIIERQAQRQCEVSLLEE
eukprot:CAMPEP_0206514040 /NCGR_PEP_ID=MMETSP0324_2-20121206/61886_1 /ASSEMBLY_ACC=CAM_ASM_000836 /TAXON_ID=2866 /ORGANISM="Crypthecodinium cohnii, Strain Seligo" /LENGTH=474 /DNA_ID=CAMNT_0054006409 /DNA_START=137 /DNA_END=1563 /DNA_ORIENTATION=+